MNITILGSGNMAFFLATSLQDAGHDIIQIYARRAEQGALLAKATGAELVNRLETVGHNADVYVFAIPDDALAGLAAAFSCPGKIVVHCSGSLSPDILAPASALRGVIWPLYSIRKNDLPQPAEVPLIVDAGDEATMFKIAELAGSISPKTYRLGWEERQRLHLAAVMSNNFINHLLTISEALVATLKLPPDLLSPILQQTFREGREHSPAENQTGPAIRHDEATIKRHMALLKSRPEWREIYQVMTRSIQQFYTDKKK